MPLSYGASLVAQLLKNPPAVQETQVQPLGPEDPLGKRMVPTAGFLPGEFHGQRSLVGHRPRGLKECEAPAFAFHPVIWGRAPVFPP